jgi:hypothetical protein
MYDVCSIDWWHGMAYTRRERRTVDEPLQGCLNYALNYSRFIATLNGASKGCLSSCFRRFYRLLGSKIIEMQRPTTNRQNHVIEFDS